MLDKHHNATNSSSGDPLNVFHEKVEARLDQLASDSVRSSKITLIIVLICVLSLFTCWIYANEAPTIGNAELILNMDSGASARSDVLCGPRSVVGAAARLGIPIDLEEYAKRCHVGAGGATLFDLLNASWESMLFAQGVQLTWPQLVALDTPVVLYLHPNHFAFVDPREKPAPEIGDAVRLYDYPMAARWVARQELEQSWRGETLIIRNRIQTPQMLKFETLLDDFGAAPGQGQVDRTIRFRNESNEPVEIKAIDSSCGCTVGRLDRRRYEPGEQGELTVTVKLSGRRGVQRQIVRIRSTDRANPEFTLTVQGAVVKPVHVSKDMIDLGQVYPGQTVRESLILSDRAGGYLNIKKIRFALSGGMPANQTPSVSAACSLTANSADRAPDVSQSGLYAVMDRGAGDKHFQIELAAHIPEQAQPGPRLGELTIDTSDRFFPVIKLPVVYYVTPAKLAVSPARLSLGVIDSALRAPASQIEIKRLDGMRLDSLTFTLLYQGKPIKEALQVRFTPASAATVMAVIALNPEKMRPLLSAGLNRGALQISDGNQQLTVPWTCFINE